MKFTILDYDCVTVVITLSLIVAKLNKSWPLC